MAVHRIEGVIQNYPWGSRDAIASLQGRPPASQPEAELWLGTHPRGSAKVIRTGNAAADLRSIVGGELPFLFKVLAAETPLSLQAHPSADQALQGYEDEDARGVPLDAPHRNYKDTSHKPEMICALSPFFALSGFRSLAECVEVTRTFDVIAQLGSASEALLGGDLATYFRSIFSLDVDALKSAIAEIRLKSSEPDLLAPVARAVAPFIAQIATRHPRDPGVLAALLLNFIELSPGQAIYLPAGNLHAYLQGTGLELMAASDNVLRGGLTDKHVDVNELTKILSFEPYKPEIIDGQEENLGAGVTRQRYPTPATEFELTLVSLPHGGTCECGGPSVLLCLEGQVVVKNADSEVPLDRGQAAFIEGGSDARMSGRGSFALASLPGVAVV